MSEKKAFDIINWLGNRKSRWLLHMVFWLGALVFYTFFFGYHDVDYKITFSFVIILLPITMATTYFLNYELIPGYLFKRRYFKFLLYFIYTLIISFYLEMLTILGIFVLVAEYQLDELHPSNTDAMYLIAGMYLVVFLGAAIKLFSHYHKNQLEIQKLSREKVEAELKFLKTQLHPHFLFNTLNNLYSLTIEKSDKAADVVLKLSALLDYVLYKSDADFVPIRNELEQLEHYIELEQLRYGNRLDVSFSYSEEVLNIKFPPMVLITLLENSFKHGVSTSIDRSWISIELEIRGKNLIIELKNSIASRIRKDDGKSGGIGLENIRNRLILTYKDQVELETDRKADAFEVRLTIFNFDVHEN